MSKFFNVLKELRLKHNLTQSELANKLNLSRSTIGMYESGEREPSFATLKTVANFFNVDMNKLLGSKAYTDDTPALSNSINHLEQKQTVPLLGTIACGAPILAEQNIEKYTYLPENVNADFVLTCKGDSMIEANIFEGDFVFINQQPNVENGEIAAVLINDEATLKKVFKDDNKLTLMPANNLYAPTVYIKSEIDDVKILGKAVAVLRYL